MLLTQGDLDHFGGDFKTKKVTLKMKLSQGEKHLGFGHCGGLNESGPHRTGTIRRYGLWLYWRKCVTEGGL